MSELLRDRIAAVQEIHVPFPYAGGLECSCGEFDVRPDGGPDMSEQLWAVHVADAVIAELRLHPVESLDRRFIRWVTAWRNNPELSDDE